MNLNNDDKNLDYARLQVSQDPMAKLLGIELIELSTERAIVGLTPHPHHLNALGVVHGSALYALLDQAAAVACNASAHRAILFQSQINFLTAARPAHKLRAVATPLSIKRRLSVWEVKITDDTGQLIAFGQSTAYHFI